MLDGVVCSKKNLNSTLRFDRDGFSGAGVLLVLRVLLRCPVVWRKDGLTAAGGSMAF